MSEKEKENIRNLSGIMKDENLEKGFDSISEIPNSSFDNKKNNSFITDQSIESNLRASLNTSSTKKKNDMDKMTLFLEKLSQNMQNVDFKLSLTNSSSNKPVDKATPQQEPFSTTTNNNLSGNSSSPVNPFSSTKESTNINNGTYNNSKQKEIISNKYNINNNTNTSLSMTKHLNNFNVIDEIAEEDIFSRASRVVSNADLELIILQNQNEQQKISDKIKKNTIKTEKTPTTLHNQNKISANFSKNTNKSSATLNPNSAVINKSGNVKSYIKENKPKITSEPGLSINTNPTETSLPNYESNTTRNTRTNRISPDTALTKKENRETVSRDIKKDERKRAVSRTPPKLSGEIKYNKEIMIDTNVNTLKRDQPPTDFRKPSISPDLKKDNRKLKPPEIDGNNINPLKKDKEKQIRTEKIEKVANDKGKKAPQANINTNSINNNLKKVIKLKEKEIQRNEETKKPLQKQTDKKKIETKNSLTRTVKKDSQKTLKNEESLYNFEDLNNLNIESKDFFELIYIVSEIYSNSVSAHEVAKTLRGLLDLNSSESDSDLRKTNFHSSQNEGDSKGDHIQIIQKKWREYKLCSILDLNRDNKADIHQKSKLVLLENLMRQSEFKKILSTLSFLLQQWKDLLQKKPSNTLIKKALKKYALP